MLFAFILALISFVLVVRATRAQEALEDRVRRLEGMLEAERQRRLPSPPPTPDATPTPPPRPQPCRRSTGSNGSASVAPPCLAVSPSHSPASSSSATRSSTT